MKKELFPAVIEKTSEILKSELADRSNPKLRQSLEGLIATAGELNPEDFKTVPETDKMMPTCVAFADVLLSRDLAKFPGQERQRKIDLLVALQPSNNSYQTLKSYCDADLDVAITYTLASQFMYGFRNTEK